MQSKNKYILNYYIEFIVETLVIIASSKDSTASVWESPLKDATPGIACICA